MRNEVRTLTNIALESRDSIVDFNNGSDFVTDEILSVFTLELLRIGYTLTDEAKTALKGFNEARFTTVVDEVYKYVSEMSGVNVYHRALFSDFPNTIPDNDLVVSATNNVNSALLRDFFDTISVMNDNNVVSDEAFNTLECGHQVSIYITDNEDQCPVCNSSRAAVSINQRITVSTFNAPKRIDIISKKDVNAVVKSILSSKTGMSSSNEESVKAYIGNGTIKEIASILPEEIPFKESVSFVIGEILESQKDSAVVYDLCRKYIKTGKDVMRVAELLNDAVNPYINKFKLSNAKRKLIVRMLNDVKNPVEDMIKERDKWVALNMILHFGSFKNKFPNAFNAVDRVLNRPETIKTFEGKLEESIQSKNINELMELASQRPGIFGRNLDHFVRKFPEDVETILNAFIQCGDAISARVLVTTRNNFTSRLNGYEGKRMFANKRGFVQEIKTVREDIPEENCKKAIEAIDAVFKNKLKSDDYTGKKVYIDEKLYDFKVPLKMRSMKNTMNKAERGSHIAYENEDKEVMRMFIYWKENKDTGRVDLDLSAMACDEQFNPIAQCAYYNQYHDVLDMRHSGDITSAPRGASEFIDIKMNLKGKARYVLMYVNSFSNQSLDEFEAFCGVMFLNKGEKQKLYHPERVEERFDLTSDAKSVLCYVYDLKENRMIWADMADHTTSGSNLLSHADKIADKVKFLINEYESALSIGQYLNLLVESNNMVVVDEEENADIVLNNTLVTNTDEFNSKWLM